MRLARKRRSVKPLRDQRDTNRRLKKKPQNRARMFRRNHSHSRSLRRECLQAETRRGKTCYAVLLKLPHKKRREPEQAADQACDHTLLPGAIDGCRRSHQQNAG